MHCGPRGEFRPADAIGNAVRVARLATGKSFGNWRQFAKGQRFGSSAVRLVPGT